MKVIFVSTLLPETNYFCYLAKALEQSGVDITVYADKNEQNKKTGLSKTKLVWSKSLLYPWQILSELLKENEPSLVHLQHEINMFGGPLTALIFPVLLIGLRLHQVKIVTTVHAVVAPEQIDQDFLETFAFPPLDVLVWPVKIFFTFLYWLIGFFSDALIVHTAGLKDMLVDSYHVDSEKISVIFHGVPEKVPTNNPKPDVSWASGLEPSRYICYFGYFHRRKGLEYVLDAFSKVSVNHPDLKLVLAGGTLQKDYEETLKTQSAGLGLLGRVIFTGFVSQDQLYWLLENSLFVLQPATYSIAASGPLAQVIAFEKPVLGNQIGVFAQEIQDNVSGLLALSCNSADMASKMELLINDDVLRAKISQGIGRLHKERSWGNIAGITGDLYNKTLSKIRE